jgi:hypothetical protein
VTSQGSPYGRFRRALDRGNVTEAMSAAADLPHLGLTEALDFSLRSEEPERSLFARCLRRGKDLVRASYRGLSLLEVRIRGAALRADGRSRLRRLSL